MGISGEELLAEDPALEHLLGVEGSAEPYSHHCSSFLLPVSSFSAGIFFGFFQTLAAAWYLKEGKREKTVTNKYLIKRAQALPLR